ncbi:MAG: KEOPS complex kinase/ATPase Bud32 [Candidatus Altiarchaeota archaeon]|nr:KEOPS complex kinase/ATPase Bud32 [Candidatus Altiarchaeota archaeon]
MRVLYQGAEAKLYLKDSVLVKERVKKMYRVEPLDLKLRKYRTRGEGKALDRARRAGVFVPQVYGVDEREYIIEMEYIDGLLVKDLFSDSGFKETEKISQMIGESVTLLHEANLVHNDLTSANMLYSKGRLYIIDFGLSVYSKRVEDKATDLVVFRKSLKATHSSLFDEIWSIFLESYQPGNRKKIISQLELIEKRVRYS